MTATASTRRPQAARRSAHPRVAIWGTGPFSEPLAEADDNFWISPHLPPGAAPRCTDQCPQDFGDVKVSHHHHRLMKNGCSRSVAQMRHCCAASADAAAKDQNGAERQRQTDQDCGHHQGRQVGVVAPIDREDEVQILGAEITGDQGHVHE